MASTQTTQGNKIGWELAIIVMLLLVSFNSSAETAPVCEEPNGFILDESAIEVLDKDCDSEAMCGVVIAAPLTLFDRSFRAFLLRKEYGQATVVHLNLAAATHENTAETSFYMSKYFLHGVEVHAVYERRQNCMLHSVIKMRPD